MFTISHEKLTMSNGLDVVLHEDHTLPMIGVNVWYHVGSKDEEIGRTGFAHLFEHVMFEGSKNHNRDYFEPLQKVGAAVNGSTTADRTNYWETVPSNQLELALWLEADRMGFLLDALDQDRFDVQRDVVKNERRQSYENRPYGLSHLVLQPAVFPAPHPYSWPVIGSQEDLDAAQLDDVKDFFRQYYAPSNASLALAGDFDSNEARRLVELYFGDLPPGPAITRVGRMDSPLRGEVSLTMHDKVQLPRLYLVWPGSPMFDEDEAPLELLSAVLSDGKSSRLYRSLVYDKQIARDVNVGSYGQEIASEFHLTVTASPGHSLEEIQEVVEEELEQLRREPPTEHEISRAKNRIESQHVRQLERIGGFGGRADQLNYYNIHGGDPGLINSDIERYLRVKADDVVRVANSALGGDRVRLAVLPEEPVSASTSSLDRSSMPAGSAVPSYTPPVPQRERLSNGLKLLHIEKPGLPMVAMGLVVNAGATTDPNSLPGLAHMTAALLPEGTADRSSQQIADEMEFLGSHLDSDAGREHTLIFAESLISHWPKALEIVADVSRNANFPARELDRVRKERLADLKRLAADATAISQRASRALVYGRESSYGHPITGTEESINAFTRDGIVDHFGAHYGPRDSTLVVVGGVSGEEITSKAEALFGDWNGADGPPGSGPDIADVASPPTTIYLVDKPGAAQSVIRAGHVTVPRHHPDYYAMSMLNYVFGGQPMARLFMNLRQDKGYSYGYYSTIGWLTGQSSILAGGAVETAVTKESVIETLKEFADIRGERPVTEEEFEAARDGMFRSFPSQFETQGQMLSQLSNLTIFDLPDDYYSSYLANLEAVTLDGLHRMAAERIDDKHLVVLVVGDRSAIEPGLKELGLPIVMADHDGRRLD